MSYATELREVRAHFGLTQVMLATWLQVNRAHLASIETGREQLPTHARPWLRPLVEALSLPDPVLAPTPALVGDVDPGHPGPVQLLARLAECNYQVQRLSQQHAALLAQHRIAARRLAARPLLQALLPTRTPTETTALRLRRRWLADLLKEAADALAPEAPAGPLAAILLDTRRRAFLHEITCLQTYLVGDGAVNNEPLAMSN